MRFNNFVRKDVCGEVKTKYSTMVDLARNIKGGWEGWLQVQIYLRLNKDGEVGTQSFTREEYYPGLLTRSDFTFVPTNASNTKTWVELKVLRNEDADTAVKEFMEDITKITKNEVKNSIGSEDTLGAILVAPVKADDVINGLTSEFIDFERIYYFVVGDDISQPQKLSRSSTASGKAAVFYWTVK
ncbi:hypothetical protein ACE3NQ_29580 [Paenibacillus terreus]|uniref:Uncharacterized protein n=1 Tax=Paenibacillus terreus TaxID=1387834 RepID=A0ABV5BH75_9BACL